MLPAPAPRLPKPKGLLGWKDAVDRSCSCRRSELLTCGKGLLAVRADFLTGKHMPNSPMKE